jgi:hypothetical protein
VIGAITGAILGGVFSGVIFEYFEYDLAFGAGVGALLGGALVFGRRR